jgi:predicted nucleotidyltransferase
MTAKNRTFPPPAPPRKHHGADIPWAEIRRFARQVAERFQPDRIILFGSHAYGVPHADSDVDLLVVMPPLNQLDQAFRIRLAIPAPFPMDLIVRTPKNLKGWLEAGDSFHTGVVSKGRFPYEKPMREWVRKAESDFARGVGKPFGQQELELLAVRACHHSAPSSLGAR